MTIQEQIQQLNEELSTILRSAKDAGRAFTEQEQERINDIRREKSYIECQLEATRLQRQAAQHPKEESLVDVVRSIAKGGKVAEVVIREGSASTTDPHNPHLTTDTSVQNITAKTLGDPIRKVSEKLIWNLLGIYMPTNLSGQYEWPVVGDLEAYFGTEGEAIQDSKLDISKVAVVQQRTGVSGALTYESIFATAGSVEALFKNQMPESIARKINNALFSCAAPTGANSGFQGPFVSATTKNVNYDYKGLNSVKAYLLGKGYDMDYLCWVMDAATYADLEATSKDAGSGRFLIEDGKLCGLPVFIASAMNGNIGLGDFRYQCMGQFGQPKFVEDPYTRAKEGKVEFTLNTFFASATLVQDAFVKVTKKA